MQYISYGFLKKLDLLNHNYRGKYIPVTGGILITGISVFIWSIFLLAGTGEYITISKLIFLMTIIAVTGLLDDIAGDNNSKGLKGHFSSLLRGKLTTGVLKVFITLMAVILVISTASID
ncbi:MAG: hypothetical protein ACOCQN_02325, partial [Halanaerobiaceae bacterium]